MKKAHEYDHSHHHHEATDGMHATRMSQLGDEPCTVEDSEEMSDLRYAEDASSLMKLGGLLISQYRYREAIPVMEKAAELEPESAKIQSKLGGTKLTLFRIEEALHHYYRALELGAAPDSVYFACGIASYFRGDYLRAAELFSKHPGDDAESHISAIYWNTLSCCRAGVDQELLHDFDPDMDAGHHEAYKKTMLVFAGYTDPSDISFGQSELDDAIIQYGLSVYYESVEDNEPAGRMLRLAADHEEVWPCISCLAAWNDLKRR